MASRFPLPKRVFDLVVIGLSLPVVLPVSLVIGALVLIFDGGPVMHRSSRVGEDGQPFDLFKFRTMSATTASKGDMFGAQNTGHVSALGHILRRTRLDELPQLINVVCGEMTLVGPRPPVPRYVDSNEELYAKVLRSRPGLTGLATLHMHRFEARLLRNTSTAEMIEKTYIRRCIPRKARLDLIYQARQRLPGALCFDVLILVRTVWSLFR